MITLCIRYTIDAGKLEDFAAYARDLQAPIERSGGVASRYYLPTKLAGATNIALALIEFASLAAYEQYRERMARDAEHLAVARRAGEAGCVLIEDRAFLQRVG
jgi:hypothetical protein